MKTRKDLASARADHLVKASTMDVMILMDVPVVLTNSAPRLWIVLLMVVATDSGGCPNDAVVDVPMMLQIL